MSLVTKDYAEFLAEVKSQIKSSQAKAALAINASLIAMYWNIGEMIAENQSKNSWGNNVIEQLAADLKAEFPNMTGFSRANLFFIRRFYLFWTDEKVQQAVRLLGNKEISLQQVVAKSVAKNYENKN
jgi:predicted nuclease of restriction endonuclease-like (RecB) superfamily